MGCGKVGPEGNRPGNRCDSSGLHRGTNIYHAQAMILRNMLSDQTRTLKREEEKEGKQGKKRDFTRSPEQYKRMYRLNHTII